MALVRAEQNAAAGAFVEEMAGVGRHGFNRRVPALGAGYGRLQDWRHVRHKDNQQSAAQRRQ